MELVFTYYFVVNHKMLKKIGVMIILLCEVDLQKSTLWNKVWRNFAQYISLFLSRYKPARLPITIGMLTRLLAHSLA